MTGSMHVTSMNLNYSVTTAWDRLVQRLETTKGAFISLSHITFPPNLSSLKNDTFSDFLPQAKAIFRQVLQTNPNLIQQGFL